MKSEELIFDLGFFDGSDTDYYLYRGNRVIAVEADPMLVEDGNRRFRDQILSGQLKIINAAVASQPGHVSFYVNPERRHHSSVHKGFAEFAGGQAQGIEVEAIQLRDLFELGTPHYMKVDVEGADSLVARSLIELPKPKYVSFEIGRTTYPDIFSALHIAGYSKFQLVNQMNNPKRLSPYKFSEHSSGFFGEDLPKEKWLSYQEAVSRYVKYAELRDLDREELSLGWLDLHAML